MQNFLISVIKKAQENPKTIVFPEGDQLRILQAVEEIQKQKIAKIILIGDETTIKKIAEKNSLNLEFSNLEIINPLTSELTKKLADNYYILRKEKGVTKEIANKKILDVNYFGTMLVHTGYADGMVTGTLNSTADSIRPALQIIKTKEKFHKVSGVFFMILKDRLLLFADAAVSIEPNSHDLSEIAIDTAKTAEKFGITPKLAFLSFSTNSSAKHPLVDKIKEAVALTKNKRPDLIIEGEMQVDAALVPEVSKQKFPNSKIHGDANILIFPNLEAANIAYKLVERLAKAQAIGPILQGLKKPINDLSRGCNYNDIVHITAFTVCECQ